MSYYWNNVNVPAGETVTRAVMFSVYGADETTAAKEMIEEAKAVYHTVTWLDGDNNVILKSVVKDEDPAVYDGDTPEKTAQESIAYIFNGKWNYDGGSQDGDQYNSEGITSDITLKAQFNETANPDKLFVGHKISLDGDIGVYFYLDKAEVKSCGADGKTGVVRFSRTVKGEEKTDSASFTIGSSEDMRTETVNGQDVTYYVVKCDVPAPEMAYKIHAAAYIDGKEHWDKDDYSVKDYGEHIIDNYPAYGEALTDLAKEMLNYGAKCQIVFDRVEESAQLANSKYSDYTMAEISAEDFDTAINTQNNGGYKSDMRANTGDLTYRGSSVVYLTKTSLRHYYTVDSGGEYSGTYTINNINEANAFTKKDVFVYAEVQNIAACDLDVLQKVSFNGQTYKFSVLDYAKLMFTQGNTNEKNLGWATYLYNRAANIYFDNQGGN